MDTKIICRCEEITEEEIDEAIQAGADTVNEIKRFTRAGMGLCQGRICRRLIERMLAEQTGQKIEDILPATYRHPVRPIAIQIQNLGEFENRGGDEDG